MSLFYSSFHFCLVLVNPPSTNAFRVTVVIAFLSWLFQSISALLAFLSLLSPLQIISVYTKGWNSLKSPFSVCHLFSTWNTDRIIIVIISWNIMSGSIECHVKCYYEQVLYYWDCESYQVIQEKCTAINLVRLGDNYLKISDLLKGLKNVYICWCVCMCMCVCVCSVMSKSLQPHGLYSLPGSFAHGLFQIRILQQVAISSSRGSSQPRDQTHISCINRWILYHWATWKVQSVCSTYQIYSYYAEGRRQMLHEEDLLLRLFSLNSNTQSNI